jgi:AsmA protein
MKALKLIGGILAAILILLVGGVAYVASQFDADRLKAEAAKAMLKQKQRTLKIDGELKLEFWPNVGLSIGKLSLSEHGSAQEFAAIERARISVAVLPLLSQRVVVNTVEITGARATIVKHKDGTLNIADLMTPDQSDSQPLQIDIAGVKIAGVQFDYRDEQKGSTTRISGLDLTTGHVRADTGKQLFGAESVTLGVKGKADANVFDIRIDLAGIDGSPQALKVGKLVLDIDAKAGDSALKGRLETALALDPAKQMAALEKIAGSIDIANPQLPMKQLKLPIDGALAVDFGQQSATGRLATHFDESAVALKFAVHKFAPLALGFDLDIDKLNVDKYLPPAKPDAKKAGDGKLDFSALKGLNLNGTVKIGSLQVANIKASNIKLAIKAADGRVDVAPLAANLYEGTLAGSLSLDANGNAVALKQNLAGVGIGPLLRDVADKDVLDGRGNVALDVTTHGDSVAAMKKALAGSAAVSLKDGAIKGINLAQSFRDLKARFASKQDAQQPAKAGDKTDFSEMTASFKIAGGVAHNDDLAAKSPFLRLGGSGDIDLGAGQLNYLAKASVVASTSGQGGEGLEHLKGLTVPVRLTGPFDSPSWKIELAGLGTEAIKAKVGEAGQALKQKAGDQVKDKLKGLFGK